MNGIFGGLWIVSPSLVDSTQTSAAQPMIPPSQIQSATVFASSGIWVCDRAVAIHGEMDAHMTQTQVGTIVAGARIAMIASQPNLYARLAI